MLVATVKSITANGLEAMGRHVIQPAAEKRIDRQVFYSSGSQALEERLGSESAAERQFVWNLGYVDDLVLRDRDTTNNGALDERLYSLPDLRYSVMALADDTGDVVERFAYDAYGSTSVMDSLFVSRSSSNYDWEFLYTGRREDLETGLYYFRARIYSAQLGRFLSRDPLGFVDGMSLYRAYFVPGGVDPMGLEKCWQEKQACVKGCGWIKNIDMLKGCHKKCDKRYSDCLKGLPTDTGGSEGGLAGAAAICFVVDGPLPIGDTVGVCFLICLGVEAVREPPIKVEKVNCPKRRPDPTRVPKPIPLPPPNCDGGRTCCRYSCDGGEFHRRIRNRYRLLAFLLATRSIASRFASPPFCEVQTCTRYPAPCLGP